MSRNEFYDKGSLMDDVLNDVKSGKIDSNIFDELQRRCNDNVINNFSKMKETNNSMIRMGSIVKYRPAWGINAPIEATIQSITKTKNMGDKEGEDVNKLDLIKFPGVPSRFAMTLA